MSKILIAMNPQDGRTRCGLDQSTTVVTTQIFLLILVLRSSISDFYTKRDNLLNKYKTCDQNAQCRHKHLITVVNKFCYRHQHRCYQHWLRFANIKVKNLIRFCWEKTVRCLSLSSAGQVRDRDVRTFGVLDCQRPIR